MPGRKGGRKPKRTGRKRVKFASKAEEAFAEELTNQDVAWDYEPEKIKWVPPTKKYIPDFRITREDGTSFLVEYKGYLRPEDRTKMKLVKKQHPDLDIRFVFQNAHKRLYKGSKTTYSDWATKFGFLWADKYIPTKWLKSKRRNKRRKAA